MGQKKNYLRNMQSNKQSGVGLKFKSNNSKNVYDIIKKDGKISIIDEKGNYVIRMLSINELKFWFIGRNAPYTPMKWKNSYTYCKHCHDIDYDAED